MTARGTSSGRPPVDLDVIWDDLEEGITKIYKERSSNMSKNRYIELYT